MYQLNLGESRGSVKVCTAELGSQYNGLLHVPVKAANDFYTIADILENGQAIHGQNVNLLGVVREVRVPNSED